MSNDNSLLQSAAKFAIHKILIKSISTLVLFISIISPASAQWFSNPALNAINLDVNGSSFRNSVRNQSTSQSGGKRGSQISPVVTSSDVKKLSFRVSKSQRKANLALFVRQSRELNPAVGDQLEALVNSVDIFGEFSKALTPLGLQVNNVGDVYALWWMNSWLASRGRNDNPSRTQIQAVKRQVARAMLSSSQFTGMTDAQKQQMAEALLLQAALTDAAVTQAKSNPSELRAVTISVKQGTREAGIDLDTINLTNNGFVPIK